VIIEDRDTFKIATEGPNCNFPGFHAIVPEKDVAYGVSALPQLRLLSAQLGNQSGRLLL
jgi:hypothetical protein